MIGQAPTKNRSSSRTAGTATREGAWIGGGLPFVATGQVLDVVRFYDFRAGSFDSPSVRFARRLTWSWGAAAE